MLIPVQSVPVRRSAKGLRTHRAGICRSGFEDLTLEEFFKEYTVIADPAMIACDCDKKELVCVFTDEGGTKDLVRTGVPCGKNVKPAK